MYEWFAVYLDRAQDGEPDALFANDRKALHWAAENCDVRGDVFCVYLPAPVPPKTTRMVSLQGEWQHE